MCPTVCALRVRRLESAERPTVLSQTDREVIRRPQRSGPSFPGRQRVQAQQVGGLEHCCLRCAAFSGTDAPACASVVAGELGKRLQGAFHTRACITRSAVPYGAHQFCVVVWKFAALTLILVVE